ncbi:DegT/DnrJ/EryC1/StrS aminotransferase family protein [uncultured Thiohalocapsa sp.]|uniref:DegT/DnrJ/EryC1/StrS family aminotransferase n=1 Tax=uncultured Thiohalocapsa sp. TaxID=768990 RepID=UPI0025D3C8CC|nr:DegT/DnrJ/EryC1/StrS family aminotransferase [uncultured Thiohalocapsa sp.]
MIDMQEPIPYLDLNAQHRSLRRELIRAIDAVFASSAFAGGTFVERFEKAFADYCGCRHAIGVGSGTDALWLALQAVGVGPGDEVITVPNSFFATAEAITVCGARPVFVDVDEATLTLDPKKLEAAITPRTKAVVPVHLFGQIADMNPINRIADRHGLSVIEDAAQGHGASYHGRRAGGLGRAGCFSFYPGKNLGAAGEAGAVTTNDDDLAARVRMLRDHGQARKHDHQLVGWNGRMDGVQAAVLEVKLRHLDTWTQRRRERAYAYQELISRVPGLRAPTEAHSARHVYHIYGVRCDGRDDLLRHLSKHNVGCAIHYPRPIHLQPAYHDLGYGEGCFPVSEQAANQLLSLPLYPELGMEKLQRVATLIADWHDGQAMARQRETSPNRLATDAALGG